MSGSPLKFRVGPMFIELKKLLQTSNKNFARFQRNSTKRCIGCKRRMRQVACDEALILRCHPAMTTFEELRTKVQRRIPVHVYSSVLRFVQRRRPQLWGLGQPENFVEATLCYTIYMDLKRCGMNRLRQKLDLGFHLSNKSIEHNAKKMRQLLGDWGRSQIKSGRRSSWNRAARHVRRPAALEV